MLRNRLLARNLIAFAGYFVIAVLVTWPLAIRLSSAVPDPGDPYLTAWILNWDHWATARQPFSLFHANVFHPAQYALAFSEHLYGVALATYPLYLIGLDALTVHGLAMLLGFAFSGFGAFVLGWTLTRNASAAFVAGVLFELLPFRFDHMSHLQHLWAGFLPLLLAAMIHFYRVRTWRAAVLVGAAILGNGLTNVHWLLFGLVAAGFTGLALLGMTLPGEKRKWNRVAVAVAGAVLLLLPFLLPYEIVSERYGLVRTRDEAVSGSANWSDWLSPPSTMYWYSDLAITREGRIERNLFPGFVLIVLAIAGILMAGRQRENSEVRATASQIPVPRKWLRVLDVLIVLLGVVAYVTLVNGRFRLSVGGVKILSVTGYAVSWMWLVGLTLLRLSLALPRAWQRDHVYRLSDVIRVSPWPVSTWTCVLWICVGILGSFGMNAFFHEFLFEEVKAFRSIRVPARWAMIAYAGLAGLASLGAKELIERGSGRWARPALVLAFTVISVVECWPGLRWYHARPAPPVYRWLAEANISSAVVELPFGNGGDWREVLYMLRSTVHHKKLVNGVSGFAPPEYLKLVAQTERDPIDSDFFSKLAARGCGIVIMHAEVVGRNHLKWSRAIGEALATGELVVLRRFDHDVSGDYVFAIPSVEKQWRSLLATPTRDRAGFTLDENLRRFLAGNLPTYNTTPFGVMDSPRPAQFVWGELQVFGWALANPGVQAVDVWFDHRRTRARATRVAREDVIQKHPWYSEPRAGFVAVFPKRPDRVPPDTDVQIEIVSRDGSRVLLEDTLIRWENGPKRHNFSSEAWRPEQLEELFKRTGSLTGVGDVLSGRTSIYDAQSGASILAVADPEQFVRALYQAFLRREADGPGLEYYLERLGKGASRESLVMAFISADEFKRIHLK